MTEDKWGSPEHKNFARRFIRQIRYENVTVGVHMHTVEIFTEFFRIMSAAYLAIPSATRGWAPSQDEREALGLSLFVPIQVEWPPRVVESAARLSIRITDDNTVAFMGSISDADLITRAIVEKKTTELDSIENSTVEVYRPGTRSLAEGDTGADVHFLQMFLQDENDDGVFGKTLTARVLDFQQARGVAQTGVMDQETWLSMFPARTVQVAPGDGGMWPRMVQSLLVALDYSSNPITSTYGTRTVRDVRLLQEANGLRVNGFVRGPEWGALVHRPVDGFPLE